MASGEPIGESQYDAVYSRYPLIDQFLKEASIIKNDDGMLSVEGQEIRLSRLLASDRAFYRETLIRWTEEKWLPKIESRRDEILGTLEENQKRFDDLFRAIINGNAFPFVGSGMSSASGMPMWTPFIRRLADEAGVRPRVDTQISQGKYDKAAEIIERAMTKRLFDRKVKESYNASFSVISGPILYLPYIFNNVVFTTNFDNVLERVYAESDMPFNDIVYGNRSDDYSELRSPEREKRYLVKIHGTYDKPSTRILTKMEYDANYTIGSTINSEMIHLVETKSLLYIGCSLSNDRTMQLIKNACDTLPNIRESFAFLKSPETAAEKLERDVFLSQRNIFPIWYDGDHDESIQALLVGLIKRMDKLNKKSLGGYI